MADELNEHVTHVERAANNATFYWWCEADDCYASTRHYLVEAEAFSAAETHRDQPG